MTEATPTPAQLREHAGALRLHGLQAHWAEVMGDPQHAHWVAQMLSWEAAERGRRSLERRLRAAHIGRFKPLADFDWAWPRSIDRGAVEELLTLDFLKDASNVVLVGPNGVGKTMCACNLGYQAVLAGHTALFITAGNLLGELAALDSDSGLRRKLRQYAAPDLLLIDEVGCPWTSTSSSYRMGCRAKKRWAPLAPSWQRPKPGSRRWGSLQASQPDEAKEERRQVQAPARRARCASGASTVGRHRLHSQRALSGDHES
jgi:hypothetical protein